MTDRTAVPRYPPRGWDSNVYPSYRVEIGKAE